jgi:membrane protease YdiL (CAAX protease family)
MIPLLIILLNLGCFVFIYQITNLSSRNHANGLQQVVGNKQKLNQLNLKHLYCILVFLVVLIVQSVVDQSIFQLFNIPAVQVFFPVIVFSFVALIISLYTPLDNEETVSGEKLCAGKCSQSPNPLPVFASYFVIRILYLITYEIFFRLTLFESLSMFSGTNSAIIISTILYGLHHRFSSKIEFYTSFLFGFVLSWLVIHTGSIFPAIAIHLLLSLPYELRLIYHQKNLSL